MIDRDTGKVLIGRLKNLRLSELSLVDNPANKAAMVTIFKRDDSITEKIWKNNAELPDGVKNSLPGEAQTVFRNVANRALKGGASEESAMKQAWTAVKNGWRKEGDKWVRKEFDDPDRVHDIVSMVQKASFDELMDAAEAMHSAEALRAKMGEYWNVLQHSMSSIYFDDEVAPANKGAKIKQSVDQFVSALGELDPEVEKAARERFAAEPVFEGFVDAGTSGAPDNEGEPPMPDVITDALKTQIAELQKLCKDQADENAALKTEIAGLKSAAEVAKTDETADINGRTVRKSVVGEDVFQIMKEQAERLEVSDFEKIAENGEHRALPGEPMAKARALRAVSKLTDENIRKTLGEMLKAGNSALAKTMGPVGRDSSPDGDFKKASEQLDDLAAELRKQMPQLSKEQAFARVLDTPEGGRLYAATTNTGKTRYNAASA